MGCLTSKNKKELGDSGEFNILDIFIQLVGRMSARVLCGKEMCRNPELFELIWTLRRCVDRCDKSIDREWGNVFEVSGKAQKRLKELLEPLFQIRYQRKQEDPENWMEKHGYDDFMAMYIDTDKDIGTESIAVKIK